MRLDCCPFAYVTPDVWKLFEMAEWASKGHLPAPGAVLEQTQSFMDALRFYRSEKAALVAEPAD